MLATEVHVSISSAMVEIIELQQELSSANLTSAAAEDRQQVLASLMKCFNQDYYYPLKEVLDDIYDEYSPDYEALMPANYIAKEYMHVDGQWSVAKAAGVAMHIDEFDAQAEPKLVLLPNPARLVLMTTTEADRILWSE